MPEERAAHTAQYGQWKRDIGALALLLIPMLM